MARSASRRRAAPGGPFDRFAGGFGHLSLTPGRGALALAAGMALLTAVHTWLPAAHGWLTVGPWTLADLRLTGLLSNGLLARPASAFGLLIMAAIAGLLFADRVRGWWYRDRVRLIGGVVAAAIGLMLLQTYVLPGRAYGLVVGGAWLVFVGTAVERRWGTRRLLLFSATIMAATNLVGALLSWIWPGGLGALLTDGALPLFGENPLTHALMAVWCFMNARQRMALLRVEARALVWVLVAFDALDLLFGGAIAGLMGLSAIGLTWLLITGNHRPGVLIDKLRLWRIERRVERRRAGIRVVGGRDHLHRGLDRVCAGRPALRST